MKLKTTRFGTLDLVNEKIINMPKGMLGFPDKKQYVILKHKDESPFFWYQSVDDPALAFVITNPFLFKEDYHVDMGKVLEKMSWLGEENESDLGLYVVVNIPKGSPDKMTANLIGPLFINNKTCQAAQMILPDSDYSHQSHLFE